MHGGAPAQPWRASISPRAGSSATVGGPRYGPPRPPTLGRAPAQPWRASISPRAGSSATVGGPPIWPPTPPDARPRPGAAVARLDLAPRRLIGHCRGPPALAPPPPPPPPAP